MANNLLLLDDSPLIHRVVELTFEGQEYAVQTADDPDEALSLARSLKPALVLASVELKTGDGLDFCRRLRQEEETAQTPLILLTGAQTRLSDDQIGAVGAAGLIQKPFEPDRLLAEVNRVVSTGGAPMVPAGVDPSDLAAEEALPAEDEEEALFLEDAAETPVEFPLEDLPEAGAALEGEAAEMPSGEEDDLLGELGLEDAPAAGDPAAAGDAPPPEPPPEPVSEPVPGPLEETASEGQAEAEGESGAEGAAGPAEEVDLFEGTELEDLFGEEAPAGEGAGAGPETGAAGGEGEPGEEGKGAEPSGAAPPAEPGGGPDAAADEPPTIEDVDIEDLLSAEEEALVEEAAGETPAAAEGEEPEEAEVLSAPGASAGAAGEEAELMDAAFLDAEPDEETEEAPPAPGKARPAAAEAAPEGDDDLMGLAEEAGFGAASPAHEAASETTLDEEELAPEDIDLEAELAASGFSADAPAGDEEGAEPGAAPGEEEEEPEEDELRYTLPLEEPVREGPPPAAEDSSAPTGGDLHQVIEQNMQRTIEAIVPTMLHHIETAILAQLPDLVERIVLREIEKIKRGE